MDIMVTSQGGQANLNLKKTTENIKVVEGKDAVKEINHKENDYDKKELDKALNKLNGFLKDEHTVAEYSVHETLGNIMIKIINQDTKEVIMELPPKKILDLVAKMMEMAGVIVNEKA